MDYSINVISSQLTVLLKASVSYFLFCRLLRKTYWNLQLHSWVWKYLLTVLFFLCVFWSSCIGVWMFRIITSSWWTDLIVIMKSFFTLVTFFVLRSTLSDINTASFLFSKLALTWYIFSILLLLTKVAHIWILIFKIQSDKLCHLIGVFMPFTLKVIIVNSWVYYFGICFLFVPSDFFPFLFFLPLNNNCYGSIFITSFMIPISFVGF